ncbi:RasGAP domain-containing protein [Aporhodopirellula aestuarii]|uniref:Ras-GAP domain-containing protein n=1 Tax=Aporhodopirellula aestuarii TaxID=2950107 RepID=A0ABT0TZ72_9BACT|nr:hypothetical protein [Aporhodopirellula aestuarii]MCM2369904.1 hypothetical protein [Aporhodopirellula aestuarii]
MSGDKVVYDVTLKIGLEQLYALEQEILESRAERDRQLDTARSEMSEFAGRPRVTNHCQIAMEELEDERRNLLHDFDDRLGPEDELFRTSVLEPVAALLPRIENEIKQKRFPIGIETLPELSPVLRNLEFALRAFSEELQLIDRDQLADRSAQLELYIEITQFKMDALARVLESANQQADRIAARVEELRGASLQELEDAQVIETVHRISDAITANWIQDIGDVVPDAGEDEIGNPAREDLNALANFYAHCDDYQRQAVLESGLAPKALGVLLPQIEFPQVMITVETIVNEFAQDDEYMDQLLGAMIADEFSNASSSTSPLRSKTASSKLLTTYALSSGGIEFCQGSIADMVVSVKDVDLSIKLPQDISMDDREAYMNALATRDANIETHINLFRQFVEKICAQPVPSSIAKSCMLQYDAAMKRFAEYDDAPRRAIAYVGGFVVLRLICPALTNYDFQGDRDALKAATIQSRLIQSLASGTEPENVDMQVFVPLLRELRTRMDDFLMLAVNRGRAAYDEMSASDEAVLALESNVLVGEAFSEPSESDPLGTLAADASTVLGNAINDLRTQRSTDYEWDSLVTMREANQADFDTLVMGERREILNLVAQSG